MKNLILNTNICIDTIPIYQIIIACIDLVCYWFVSTEIKIRLIELFQNSDTVVCKSQRSSYNNSKNKLSACKWTFNITFFIDDDTLILQVSHR